MLSDGENLSIVATLGQVKAGERFEELPAYMPILENFRLPSSGRVYLENALHHYFQNRPVFQHAIVGEPGAIGNQFELYRVEEQQWAALRTLIRERGGAGTSDIFRPRVSATRNRPIRSGEHLKFTSVALVGRSLAAISLKELLIQQAQQLKRGDS